MTNTDIMTLSQHEYETIMADTSKRIEDRISWKPKSSHGHAQQFRQSVLSDREWPLFINGWWNPHSRKLSYALIFKKSERMFGLDVGDYVHHNPTCQSITGEHIHRWHVETKDKIAIPATNTGNWDQPLEVWEQFCSLTVITHRGKMTMQERLL